LKIQTRFCNYSALTLETALSDGYFGSMLNAYPPTNIHQTGLWRYLF